MCVIQEVSIIISQVIEADRIKEYNTEIRRMLTMRYSHLKSLYPYYLLVTPFNIKVDRIHFWIFEEDRKRRIQYWE